MLARSEFEIVSAGEYGGFSYVCAKNYFGAYVAYVDVDRYQFLGEEEWYDQLPFHGGCTFSGTHDKLPGVEHWFIGCDWAHDTHNMYGIESAGVSDVEGNIREVIDAIPPLLIKYALMTGKDVA